MKKAFVLRLLGHRPDVHWFFTTLRLLDYSAFAQTRKQSQPAKESYLRKNVAGKLADMRRSLYGKDLMVPRP